MRRCEGVEYARLHPGCVMMIDELKRNGSGYYDPTAYKAMKNIENGGEDMEFRRGEIYEYMLFDKMEYTKAIIVSSDERATDRFLNVITLIEEPKGRINVPIHCGVTMYADCGMVSFAKNDRFGKYIRTATADEMKELEDGIKRAFGIKGIESIPKVEKVAVQDDETIKLKTERDLYKSLYEQLFERLIKG